ncbi:hypothetical protein Mapa_000298 [Marchantia paleacea]|nr:hypothetical protein Mapa_000298 [Marchantia paleacea]
MGDNRVPCVVVLDGGDGKLDEVLGLAFVTQASSPPPVDRSRDGGATAETSTSLGRFRIEEDIRRSFDHERGSGSWIHVARGFSIGRPSKLKAAVKRCLRFRRRASGNLQLKDIVPLLFLDDSPVLQEQAARALVQLSSEEAQQCKVLEHSRALEGLVKLLFKSDSPNLQIHAALSLGNLALAQDDDEQQLWFLRYPQALAGLVNLLFEDGRGLHQRSREITVQVHQEAAMALGNIASTTEGGAMIMANSYALEGLIRLLFMHERRGAQEAATRVVVHLAMVEDNVQRLLEFPISIVGALSGLLLDHSRPALQDNVCKAISCLSSTPEHGQMVVRCVHFPRTLERLISLLALFNASAILPLSNLAINEEIQASIAHHPNVLEAALMCRFNRTDNVAMFLGNLSLAKANRSKIVECPGFLPAMVDMLFNDSDPDGQEQAAWTLSNLSRAQQENLPVIMNIADWPGIVGGLIHVLTRDESPGAQEQVSRVLANLSYAPENDAIIARFPDAWTCLVPLLSKSENISMLKEVTRALSNLTSIDGLSQLNVTSKCVSSLANVILEFSSHGYRCSRMESVILEQTALALGNLTLDKSNKWKVGANEDAVAALLGLLLRFEYPSVQEKAAWALVNLYQDEDIATVPTKLPQVIPILRILLSMEETLTWRP